jgi:hypothetical protein
MIIYTVTVGVSAFQVQDIQSKMIEPIRARNDATPHKTLKKKR